MQHECYLVDQKLDDEKRVGSVMPATWRHEEKLTSPRPLIKTDSCTLGFFHLVLKSAAKMTPGEIYLSCPTSNP